METKRLFVAVEIPADIRHKIYEFALQLEQDGVKIVEEENLHITLKFLGDVQSARVPGITEMLKKVPVKKFKCALGKIGAFPKPDYVRVVWVGAESKELAELAAGVADCLAGVGKEEDRPFSPHLTIARVKKKVDLRAFLERNKNIEFGAFEVGGFSLFESTLTREGPVYKKLAEF